jgi:exopolyphosphatase/guanosine-5'-triphosphate,3'-diphosphate pyrophosphatase
MDIFPAGIAILSAVMESLHAERVHFSDATLPLGILYQMLGLGADRDPCSSAVWSLVARFQIDQAQAGRVQERALALLRSARPGIDIRHVRILDHAALLHEIGLSVSPQGHQRHGAYLLQHTGLRGYEPVDRQALTWLVRGHRRALPAAIEAMAERLQYPELPAALFALRLAVVLERARGVSDEPGATLEVAAPGIRLGLPAGWLANHQLSAAGLEDERVLLARQGFRLEVTESP